MFTIYSMPKKPSKYEEQIDIYGGDLCTKFSIHEYAANKPSQATAWFTNDKLRSFLDKQAFLGGKIKKPDNYWWWEIKDNHKVIYLINAVLKEFDSDEAWGKAPKYNFTIEGSDCGTSINLIDQKSNKDDQIKQGDKVISAINRVLRP